MWSFTTQKKNIEVNITLRWNCIQSMWDMTTDNRGVEYNYFKDFVLLMTLIARRQDDTCQKC